MTPVYLLDSDEQGGLAGWCVTFNPYREHPVRYPDIMAVPTGRIYWNGIKVVDGRGAAAGEPGRES